jgi:hypothetical protein
MEDSARGGRFLLLAFGASSRIWSLTRAIICVTAFSAYKSFFPFHTSQELQAFFITLEKIVRIIRDRSIFRGVVHAAKLTTKLLCCHRFLMLLGKDSGSFRTHDAGTAGYLEHLYFRWNVKNSVNRKIHSAFGQEERHQKKWFQFYLKPLILMGWKMGLEPTAFRSTI